METTETTTLCVKCPHKACFIQDVWMQTEFGQEEILYSESDDFCLRSAVCWHASHLRDFVRTDHQSNYMFCSAVFLTYLLSKYYRRPAIQLMVLMEDSHPSFLSKTQMDEVTGPNNTHQLVHSCSSLKNRDRQNLKFSVYNHITAYKFRL